MASEFVNSRGIKFHLHRSKDGFFFNRDPKDAANIPKGHFVEENEKTGIPVLRKLLVREVSI